MAGEEEFGINRETYLRLQSGQPGALLTEEQFHEQLKNFALQQFELDPSLYHMMQTKAFAAWPDYLRRDVLQRMKLQEVKMYRRT